MAEKLKIEEIFGNRVRVRACGICIVDDELLLVRHKFLGKNGYLWTPPGGGVSFGENVEDCLKREFIEETGLEIKVERFLSVVEFVELPLHAIELFFLTSFDGGEIKKGKDPELAENQIIDEVKFCSFEFIKSIDKNSIHRILHNIRQLEDLKYLPAFVR